MKLLKSTAAADRFFNCPLRLVWPLKVLKSPANAALAMPGAGGCNFQLKLPWPCPGPARPSINPAGGRGWTCYLTPTSARLPVWLPGSLALRANSYVKLFPESVTNITSLECLWQTRNEVAVKFSISSTSKSTQTVQLSTFKGENFY